MKMTEVENYLRGKALNEETAREAAEIALRHAIPLEMNGYKIEMAKGDGAAVSGILRKSGTAEPGAGRLGRVHPVSVVRRAWLQPADQSVQPSRMFGYGLPANPTVE